MRRLFLGLAMTGIAALTPSWALAGDQEVAQQIAANLRDSGKMKGYSIGVKVNEGTVWLGGTVRSEQQLTAAVAIAQQTPGVEQVFSNLSLDAASQAGQLAPSDSSASRRIAAARPAVGSAVRQVAAEMPEHKMTQLAVAGTPAGIPDGDLAPPPPSTLTTRSNTPRPMARSAGYPQMAMASGPVAMAQPVAGDEMEIEDNGQLQTYGQGQVPGPMPGAYNRGPAAYQGGQPMPAYLPGGVGGAGPARFDHPQMPGYAWPSYAAHPNYAAVTYPKQYSPTAWPFIGPFYPYPQVPLGWRKVTLEWDDGWWMLDFKD